MTMHKTSSTIYWKQKISAHLHDSPNKVLDILGHEASAKSLGDAFGFVPEEHFRKDADFAASAADRLPWPKSGHCMSAYDLVKNPLKHPLSGQPLELAEFQNKNRQAEEVAHRTMPSLENTSDDRLRFLALWRFWQNWASDRSPQIGFYPAETRLPDHTIWSHLSITSAMQGCCGGSQADWDPKQKQSVRQVPDSPAMLLFSIGPVQEFIAAARNTRDLWSGSYLLSYLAATALTKIATDFGPDHVIFPNLKGQPIIDLLMKPDWEQCGSSKESNFWESFDYSSPEGKDALITPSLPNRFLALLPHKMAEHDAWESAEQYAAELAETVKEKLRQIAHSVKEAFAGQNPEIFLKERFDQQVDDLLQIHWQIMPMDLGVAEIRQESSILPQNKDFQPCAGLDTVLKMVHAMPKEHRDERYFINRNTTDAVLKQPSAAWPAYYALTGWQLDGAKALRPFRATSPGEWQKGRAQNKDSLTGKEEACLIAPANEKDCEELLKSCFREAPKNSLKPNEFLGAATLIKRFWHLTWLCAEHDFKPIDFAMPNTHDIASHTNDRKKWEHNDEDEDAQKYYAILALDGDEIGKWVSGANLPLLKNLLSKEALEYFKTGGNADFLEQRRPLSPSYHLQFSEMLGNFSLYCTRRIVEHYDGRLIYAGGDDVLAMLPADTVLDCAAALRAAFRGDAKLPAVCPELFQRAPAGCIQIQPDQARKRYRNSMSGDPDPLISDPHRFPALVPGPACDVSCGISIGHIKAPLQDMVRAAQAAEKRAKNELKRAACAISLFKRSGEILQWGNKWESPGSPTAPVLPLLKLLIDDTTIGKLSNRFPYSLTARLQPFVSRVASAPQAQSQTDPAFAANADAIVRHEMQHCLQQHHNEKAHEPILGLFEIYWQSLDSETGRGLGGQPEAKINDFLGLLATLAWLNKH